MRTIWGVAITALTVSVLTVTGCGSDSGSTQDQLNQDQMDRAQDAFEQQAQEYEAEHQAPTSSETEPETDTSSRVRCGQGYTADVMANSKLNCSFALGAFGYVESYDKKPGESFPLFVSNGTVEGTYMITCSRSSEGFTCPGPGGAMAYFPQP